MAGFAIFRTYRRAPIPEGVRDAFKTVPAPPTATPGTAELDPRAEDRTVRDPEMHAAGK